jgi:hypothetical protein
MGKYRYRKPRYWNKHTSLGLWMLYRVKSLYYRIRKMLISFLSFLWYATVFLIGLVVIFEIVAPSDDPVMNSILHTHVLNIAGADGHRITLVNNVSARDPSYTELLNFLRVDETDKIQYDYGSFVCADFAETVHNNAENAGIKAGYVTIDFYEIDGGHACNVFNTTDRGLVFIDCTDSLGDRGPSNNDRVVTVKEGSTYYLQYLFASERWRAVPMGTVKTYEIYW